MTITEQHRARAGSQLSGRLTHLQRLEAEAIHIMREAVAESERPAMLYSVGKDSSVMLHLALKAFYPSRPPFPLVHVDTTWKFSAMYAFRDETAAEARPRADRPPEPRVRASGASTRSTTARRCTPTCGRRRASSRSIDQHRFDLCFGGARRDEEKSRAKERVFSMRSPQHQWDPKRQRPGAVVGLQRPAQPGRDVAGVPAVELDRARRLAVHPPRADPDRAAVLRRAPAGRRARRRC